jgi:hypothetical protein
MTWNAKQQRWFTKYRKKQYTVSPKVLGAAPTKEGSVQAANDWWKTKRAEIDKAAEAAPAPLPPVPDDVVERLKALHPDATQPELEGIIRYEQEAREDERQRRQAFWAEEDAKDRMYAERKRKMEAGATVSANVKDFLETKKRDITLNEVTKDRWDSLRTGLEQFRDWFGAERPLDDITEDTLSGYRNHLVDKVEVGDLSTYTARDRLDALRQFLRDRWRLHKLDTLPRNLDASQTAIKVRPPKIKLFAVEEIKTLLKKASERTKLYLLLMLNCGYLQTDIAELRQDEVDWSKGYIERKRHKTARFENVPVVRYKLWKETFNLLKKHRSTDAELVLVTADGTPLKQSNIKTNGKLHKTSAITEAWKRLAKKTDTKKPVKLIRKTSANLLDEHPEYGRYAVHFLGQSPRGVALKHYITPKQDQFDPAISWLGTQYGVN